MKRIVMMTAICCLLLTAGCGGKKADDTGKTRTTAQTSAVDDTATDALTAEGFDMPSRETFAEIPGEAEQSFDYVVRTIDKNFPKASKGVKRYYGYLGEKQVDGALSYVFAVYDSEDGSNSNIATAAVTADCSRVYALDENSGHYWLIEKSEAAKKPDAFSWAANTSDDALTTDEEM